MSSRTKFRLPTRSRQSASGQGANGQAANGSVAIALALCLVVCTASALLVAGCDSRSTRVSGPDFVGFDYQTSDLEGVWNGLLSVPNFDVFQTVIVEIDADGNAIGGHDSRGVDVAAGVMTFSNTSTGELQGFVRMQDNVRVDFLSLLEPGGDAITGQFLSSIGALGLLEFVRVGGDASFSLESFAGLYTIELADEETEAVRSGAIEFDNAGAVLGGSIVDGDDVDSGLLLLSETGTGEIAMSLTLSTGELIVLEGIASAVDLRTAGTTTSLSPAGTGFFLLTPIPDETAE